MLFMLSNIGVTGWLDDIERNPYVHRNQVTRHVHVYIAFNSNMFVIVFVYDFLIDCKGLPIPFLLETQETLKGESEAHQAVTVINREACANPYMTRSQTDAAALFAWVSHICLVILVTSV